jgi:hypothetical protein
MKHVFLVRLAGAWALAVALLTAGPAFAASEPTLNEVYAAAQAGKLADAQVMVQQVLLAHPNSGKAFFVRAELYARQGDLPHARESLATAEKLAPGLPFAKPEAVQALKTQLAGKATHSTSAQTAVPAVAAAAPAPSNSWALPLLLAVGVIGVGYFMFRKKTPQPAFQQPAYANPNGLAGPQAFGAGNAGAMQPAGYSPQQGGYPQPAGSGLGGRIMGGVATGLAVGAGVMAAEAIGRNLMGGHDRNSNALDSHASNDLQPLSSNPDMGGANFGVNDSSSWDDGGSVDSGGDWDN